MKKILSLFPLFFCSWTCANTSFPMPKSVILLGSIQFNVSIDRELELPILFKGKEYSAKVETTGDSHKAHFELYEEEKPETLYVLITDYLALPENTLVESLSTSPDHPYRFFKLTRTILDDGTSTWSIEEVISKQKSIKIPDNTIITFINPNVVEKIQPMPWHKESNILQLPIIKLKESITKAMLYDLADKMKLSLLDFKFLHKKANLASIPYANNRMLSMPFNTRKPIV
ncbi:MAG: hypothetical protein AB7R69_01265 [Candidatus Babeliales bacterium]